jgi:hypothetical protein
MKKDGRNYQSLYARWESQEPVAVGFIPEVHVRPLLLLCLLKDARGSSSWLQLC